MRLMSWNCTQCGAIDLNTKTCPYCGARQETASRTAQLRAASPSPNFTSRSEVSPVIYILAGIGYLAVIVSFIVNLFSGGGAADGVTKSFDNLKPWELYVYAVVGFLMIFGLIFFLLFLTNRR